MNLLDAITLLLVVVAVILGWRSGAIPQVAGLVGAIGGGAVAILALPYLADTLTAIDSSFRPIVVLLWLVGAVAIGKSIGASLGRAMAVRLGNGLVSAADRTVGAGLGVVQALLIVWLTGSLLAEGPVPRLAETAGGSTAVRTMANILPPPTEIAVGLGGWLDATGLPDVFVGFEPLPAEPVDRPSDPTARAIAAVAEASTLKISAATCGYSSVGTGFVVAPGYVVTNAHVVAGADARGVRVNAGGRVLHGGPRAVRPETRRRAPARHRHPSDRAHARVGGPRSRDGGCHARLSGRRTADDPARPPSPVGMLPSAMTSTGRVASGGRSWSCVPRSTGVTVVDR